MRLNQQHTIRWHIRTLPQQISEGRQTLRRLHEDILITRGKTRELTREAMTRTDVLRMIKRRVADTGLSMAVCCRSFRAYAGITAYIENGRTLEYAQQIAAHESSRTTKL